MSQTASLDLPDGRRLDYEIRPSAKAKSLRLKISARDGLVVIAPNGAESARVIELVKSRTDWISERLSQFDSVRHLIHEPELVRPQAFDLPALAETWRVEYQTTRARTVGARTDRPGRILVQGAVEDAAACQAALRRWLARHAREVFEPWIANIARQTELRYTGLSVKSQRTRWGSCTSKGQVSLNCKLLFLPREQVRYVIIHELCHTLEHNHSNRFWTHLRQFEPNTDTLHGRMRDAWKLIPTWAQRRAMLEI